MSLSKYLVPLWLLVSGCAVQAQYSGPQTGQKVAFMGDSITEFGWELPGGYVHLVDQALAQEGHKIEVIPAGISGQTSQDMAGRIKDLLAQHPAWMLLSCGVNDVWHGALGVALGPYKVNITSIVDQARAAGVKVTILASTPIGYRNFNDSNNTKLVAYNDFLRSLAAKDNLPFVDLNSAMAGGSTRLTKHDPHQLGDSVTFDGVHPNMMGSEIMAAGILKTWGFTDTQLAAVSSNWVQIPNGMSLSAMNFDAGNAGITLHQYLVLRACAESQGKPVRDVLSQIIADGVKKFVATAPPAQVDPIKP